MQQFRLYSKQRNTIYIVAFILFLFVLGMLLYATITMKQDTLDFQKETVEKNIQRACVECFVLEGRYPSSLDYLQEQYGFTYNKDLFFIDYRPVAENIMPDITIIVLNS